MNSRFLHDNTLIIQLKQHEYIGNFIQKYLTWKSFLYSFELEFYSVLLVFTQNYSKLVFFGNSILDSLYTRLMKATRVRVSTSVKKEVLVSEYSSEWVLSDHTSMYYFGSDVWYLLTHNDKACDSFDSFSKFNFSIQYIFIKTS